MAYLGKVDQDAVLRARTVLLGSGRISLAEQIWAHRVLAEVSPAANLPKLAEALLRFGYQESGSAGAAIGSQPGPAVFEEAVAAARRMDESDRRRAGLLIRTLNAYQRELYQLGRRAEGYSACAEMAELGRQEFEAGRAASPVHGRGRLAAVLAEEGRHREAAEIYRLTVGAEQAQAPKADLPFWSMAAWSAELDAAGEHDAAVEAFTELVCATRVDLDGGRISMAILVWELIRLSQMLDAGGRSAQARAAWSEAGVLLAELAETGERKSWSNIQSWWAALLGGSGRAAEQPPPGEPGPALGLPTFSWSPDLKAAYFDGRAALEAATVALTPLVASDPQAHLADLIAVHRRLTICSALYWQSRTYRILEPVRPLFDEGVALARRLSGLSSEPDNGQSAEILARALTDRAGFFAATQLYAEALADFQEATRLLGRG
jgi:tetratricopeptide (TPR) repeat protein